MVSFSIDWKTVGALIRELADDDATATRAGARACTNAGSLKHQVLLVDAMGAVLRPYGPPHTFLHGAGATEALTRGKAHQYEFPFGDAAAKDGPTHVDAQTIGAHGADELHTFLSQAFDVEDGTARGSHRG